MTPLLALFKLFPNFLLALKPSCDSPDSCIALNIVGGESSRPYTSVTKEVRRLGCFTEVKPWDIDGGYF